MDFPLEHETVYECIVEEFPWDNLKIIAIGVFHTFAHKIILFLKIAQIRCGNLRACASKSAHKHSAISLEQLAEVIWDGLCGPKVTASTSASKTSLPKTQNASNRYWFTIPSYAKKEWFSYPCHRRICSNQFLLGQRVHPTRVIRPPWGTLRSAHERDFKQALRGQGLA